MLGAALAPQPSIPTPPPSSTDEADSELAPLFFAAQPVQPLFFPRQLPHTPRVEPCVQANGIWLLPGTLLDRPPPHPSPLPVGPSINYAHPTFRAGIVVPPPTRRAALRQESPSDSDSSASETHALRSPAAIFPLTPSKAGQRRSTRRIEPIRPSTSIYIPLRRVRRKRTPLTLEQREERRARQRWAFLDDEPSPLSDEEEFPKWGRGQGRVRMPGAQQQQIPTLNTWWPQSLAAGGYGRRWERDSHVHSDRWRDP